MANIWANDYYAAYQAAMGAVGISVGQDAMAFEASTRGRSPFLSAARMMASGSGAGAGLTFSEGRAWYQGSGLGATVPMGAGPGLAKVGSRPMVFTPAIYATTPSLEDVRATDPWLSLGEIIGRSSEYAMNVNPTRATSRLRREIRLWERIHLQPLEGHRGVRNLGAVIGKRRRGILYMGDKGERVRELADLQRTLISGIFGGKEGSVPIDPLLAMERWRLSYMGHLEKVLRMAGEAGHPFNLAGIKDASLRILHASMPRRGNEPDWYRAQSIMTVNAGDPEATRLFALERDFMTEDRHTAAKIATMPFRSKSGKGGIGAWRLHPLVSTSEYAADVDIMRGLVPKGIGKFGTAIRAKTAYLYGKESATFARYAGLYGGAISIMKTGAGAKLAEGVGLATGFTQIELHGVRGMHEGDFGKTQLSSELLSIPGLKEAMLSPERQALELSKPYRMKGRTIAKIFGKAIREKNIHVGARLHRVEFTDTSMKLLFQETGRKFGIGTPSAIPGLKSSLTLGGKWGPAEMLAFGGKFNVAANTREAILGHYAAALVGGTARSGEMRRQRFGVLAEMAGLGLGHSKDAGYYLHGGGGRYAGIPIDRLLSEGFVQELASKTGLSAKKLAIARYSPTKAELIENMVRGGGLNRERAVEIARKIHGQVESLVLEGQPLSIRPHLFTTPRSRPRVRMGEARSFYSFLSDMAAHAGGEVGSIAGRAAEFVRGNISKKEDFLGRVLAGVYAPYYEGIGEASGALGRLPGAGGVSLSGVRDAGLYEDISRHFKDTGNISEDLLERLTQKFGITKGSIGSVVDLGAMNVAYGFPGRDMASSAATSKVFVPNPYELFGILKRESLTGFAAADIRLPKYPFEPGMMKGERGSVRASAALLNAMVELVNPEASAGTLSKRLDLMALGVVEHIVGARKAMARSPVGGFTVARYVQELSARSGLVAEVSESGLLRMSSHGPRKARERLEQYVAGRLPFERLNEAEQLLARTTYRRPGEGPSKVFAWAGRHPMQTPQQSSYAVRLMVLRDEEMAKRFGRDVIHKDTLWTSLMFQHLSQGDVDTDTVRLMLMNNTPGLSFQAQQTLLASVNAMQQKESKGIERTLKRSLAGAGPEQVFPSGLGGKIPTADELIRLQTEGAAQRFKENKLVGPMHAWATQQMQALSSALGRQDIYGGPQKQLQKIAVDVGLAAFEDGKFVPKYRMADQAAYLRPIYGFLKKRGTASDAALGLTRAANWAAENHGLVGQPEWMRKKEELLGYLRDLNKAIPGTDLAPYVGLTPGASRQIVSGQVSEAKLGQLAEMMMGVAAYKRRVREAGYSENIYTAMTRGEGPRDVAQRTMGRVLGANVGAPTGEVAEGLPEAAAALRRVRTGKAMGGKSIAQTAAANIAAEATSFSSTFARGAEAAGGFIEEAYRSMRGSHAWTGLIAAGGIAGLLAAGPGLKNVFAPTVPSTLPTLEGPPIPPAPMVGRPQDGARPSALAPRVNVARIQRTSGERTHFPVEEELYMDSPLDIYAPSRRMPMVQGSVNTAPSFPG